MPRPDSEVRRVLVLGSTGSIGTQTLQVIEHLNGLHAAGRWPTRYEVVGLAAGRNADLLAEQARRFGVRHTAREDGSAVAAAERLIELDCDVVVAAMSGTAGLTATLRAAELGRVIALANKETLVAAGALIVRAARQSGARLIPLDSEHSALWQCLGRWCHQAPPMELGPEVTRAIITASGGPFRTWTREQIAAATPEQALNHPTWRMGPKVTIDSASLMNKALEVIEAHWLFGLDADRIGVLIHPQSMVHAMVEFADGSTVAQLAAPDMRGPIQYALTHPDRPPCPQPRISWPELRRLEFEEPDGDRFPALGLAYRAIRAGGGAGAILNAANEEAVAAFLGPSGGGPALPFPQIPIVTAAAMDALGAPPVSTLADVLEADRAARRFVREHLGR